MIKVYFATRQLFHEWVKPTLTCLEDIGLIISPVHGALGHPDGPLLRCTVLGGLFLLFILLLHVDNNILGVQVCIG